VDREWQGRREEEPIEQWRPDTVEGTEDGEEKEEERSEEAQENLNVLHLLYTIAQVISS
jgi:hypothetical protein